MIFSIAGVRLDRVRGGRQKYKRSPDQVPIALSQPPIKKQCTEIDYSGKETTKL